MSKPTDNQLGRFTRRAATTTVALLHCRVSFLTMLCGAFLGAPLFWNTAQADEPNGIFGEPVVYKTVGDQNLNLYVSKPAAWSPTNRRPAIMFIHGGGWVAGSPRVFNEQSRYFASRGLVCINVEYRLLDRSVIEPPYVCMADVKSAMRWIRRRAPELGIDPNRIASAGASAGGHLAAVLGLVEGFDDPADDLSISARSQAMLLLNPVIHNGPGPYGWGNKRVADLYREMSPFHNVRSDAPPAIVFVGTDDSQVPVNMILEFKRLMEDAYVRCDVEIYFGQGHSFFNARNAHGKYFYLTTMAADRFLVSLGWLKGPPTLAPPNSRERPPPP